MSGEFVTYALIAIGAWLVALALVTPRNAFDLSRCAGWYLLLFLLTYVLRPGASEAIGENFLYRWLKIGSFEQHWQLMAVAVPMAILSFAVGYRVAANPRAKAVQNGPGRPIQIGGARQARTLAGCLIAWGYLTTVFGLGRGVERGNFAGAQLGVYEHNTAWFAQSDVFVSTGTVLYYILTGRLGMSLLIAGPWLVARIFFGWGRIKIVGHFFALLAVYFLKVSWSGKATKRKRVQPIIVMSAIVVVVVVLFPLLAAIRGIKQQLGLSAGTFSMDVFRMAFRVVSLEKIASIYLSTGSYLVGFEPSLYHLVVDRRAEWGTQYLYYYVFEPIPRILWPGKGIPFSWPEWLLGIPWDPRPAIIGLAPGSIGMAFQQWGWLGIPGEFLFTGWLMGWAEEKARRRPDAAYVQLAYAGFYTLLPQLGRDSLVYMIAYRWLFVYGIPVFILWLIHRRAAARLRGLQHRAQAGAVQPLAAPLAARL